MAKKKSTISEQYTTYTQALMYYGIKSKSLKRPNKKSLDRVKREWKKLRETRRKENTPYIADVRTAARAYQRQLQETKELQEAVQEWKEVERVEDNKTKYIPETSALLNGVDLIEQLRVHFREIYNHMWEQYPNHRKWLEIDIEPRFNDINNKLDELVTIAESIGDTEYVNKKISENKFLIATLTRIEIDPSDAKNFVEDSIEEIASVVTEIYIDFNT